VGTQTAQISITGGGISATYINLKASSTDNFLALPANGISPNGFDANWTFSANATGYTLNLFTLHNDGINHQVTLLEDEFLTGLPSGWTTGGFVDNSELGNMKLGSGSNIGKLILPELNLSASSSILTVRARQYNNDVGSQLTATIDDQPLAVWTASVSNQDFTVKIPQGISSSKITLSTATGRRAFIDYVKVETQGSYLSPISVTGYPITVGNVFTYQVNRLEPDSTYYYTVQPEGNSAIVSNRIQLRTDLTSSVKQNENKILLWNISPEGIRVRNLTPECNLNVFDILGKKIQTLKPTTSEVLLPLPQKGIYLLQIQQNLKVNTYKIIY